MKQLDFFIGKEKHIRTAIGYKKTYKIIEKSRNSDDFYVLEIISDDGVVETTFPTHDINNLIEMANTYNTLDIEEQIKQNEYMKKIEKYKTLNYWLENEFNITSL